jgi:hypothetical protein
MYVLFDLATCQSSKSEDLKSLKNFVKKNSKTNMEWWKLGTGKRFYIQIAIDLLLRIGTMT